MTRAIYRPPWRVDVTVREGVHLPASMVGLAAMAAAALDAAGAPAPASIGLILSDDAELAELNVTYMGKDGPTDVLSFPLLPPDAFPPHLGAAAARTDAGRGVPPPARPTTAPWRHRHLGGAGHRTGHGWTGRPDR